MGYRPVFVQRFLHGAALGAPSLSTEGFREAQPVPVHPLCSECDGGTLADADALGQSSGTKNLRFKWCSQVYWGSCGTQSLARRYSRCGFARPPQHQYEGERTLNFCRADVGDVIAHHLAVVKGDR